MKKVEMTSGSLWKNILLFSLPLMLTQVLEVLFNLSDVAIAGKYAYNTYVALGAVGSTTTLVSLFTGLLIGIGAGVNVSVARWLGIGDDENVERTTHSSLLICLGAGILVCVICLFFAEPMLRLLNTKEEFLPGAVLYLRIYALGLPGMGIYNCGNGILSATGDTKRPLIYLSVAGVLNVILNLVFVIGFKMSVAGVALATIISQAVSAALVTRSLMLMDGPTQLHLDRLAIKPHIMRMIIQIGLPAGIQSCMFSLSNVVIQSSVNSFGSIVIAGNAAGANVGNFVYQAMNTFQQAVTCFAGQNIGARKPRRVLSSMYVSLFWALSFGVVFGVLSCVFGTQLLGLYSPDPAVIQVGLNRMYIVCGPYFLCGIMDVMTGVLRGVGYSLLPMIVSLMGACVFRIFWVMTIFAANRTMDCLMISYPVSWALTFLVLVVIFAVLWKKKIRPRYTPEELAAR